MKMKDEVKECTEYNPVIAFVERFSFCMRIQITRDHTMNSVEAEDTIPSSLSLPNDLSVVIDPNSNRTVKRYAEEECGGYGSLNVIIPEAF
jgi:hypothetical protein